VCAVAGCRVAPGHAAVADTRPDTKKPPENRGFVCARYWDRTSDLFRVREARYRCANRARWGLLSFPVRWRRDSNPCKRLCRPVPSRSATPPCGLTPRAADLPKKTYFTRADDETRTRDPNLGKVVRYQLRYIRISFPVVPGTHETLAEDLRPAKPAANLARVSLGGPHGL
jgi:hypothetical protein